MNLEEIHEWVFGELGFCGCGDPESALKLLQSVLAIIRKRSDENEIEEDQASSQARWSRNSDALRELIGMKDDVLLGATNYRQAMAWTYLYFLDSKGLLEHGGNCSGSWLTEKGQQVLDALNRYSARSIIDCECGDEEDEVLDAKVIDG